MYFLHTCCNVYSYTIIIRFELKFNICSNDALKFFLQPHIENNLKFYN